MATHAHTHTLYVQQVQNEQRPNTQQKKRKGSPPSETDTRNEYGKEGRQKITAIQFRTMNNGIFMRTSAALRVSCVSICFWTEVRFERSLFSLFVFIRFNSILVFFRFYSAFSQCIAICSVLFILNDQNTHPEYDNVLKTDVLSRIKCTLGYSFVQTFSPQALHGETDWKMAFII